MPVRAVAELAGVGVFNDKILCVHDQASYGFAGEYKKSPL